MNGQAGSKGGTGLVPNSASRNTIENQVVIVEEQRKKCISHPNHIHVSGTVEQQGGANESRHPLVKNATNLEGDSTSSASSDKISQQEKRPNPSFRGIKKDANLTQTNREEKQKQRQSESNRIREQSRGPNWESWLSRERLRGYDSSPNTSEFSDLNDMKIARNVHHEREVLNVKDILEKNPEVVKEAKH